MTVIDYQEQMDFEADVRRVAEAIWGLQPGECQPSHYPGDISIKELDGIARLRDATHVIMATVSRRLEKTKGDVRKLNAAEKYEARPGVPVTKWFITRDQLDAEHLKHCRDNGVISIPLAEFRGRFFDARSYVAKRRLAPFGSARNLDDGSITLPDDEYVPLPFRIVRTEQGRVQQPIDVTIESVETQLVAGGAVVLLAPFGAGKSLTARQVFLDESRRYLKAGRGHVPVVINLRDHWGAKYADEILGRHSHEIGLPRREDLVVAWRAGLLTLVLDGFDELGTQSIAQPLNKNFMRDARFSALAGVRDLVKNCPSGTGILLTGRDHYFDSQSELENALGLFGRQYKVVELGEFGEQEAISYLKRKKVSGSLPGWLPRKPLLLAYLASRNLLDQVLAIDGSRGFGFAWSTFLSRICSREAESVASAIPAETLRRLLERLAMDVRATVSGTGPVTGRDLAEAFLAETGENASDAAVAQLQRLPGLTARGQQAAERSFIDEEFLAALQGSALARFILEGRETWTRRGFRAPLARKALVMAAQCLAVQNVTAQTAVAVAVRIVSAPHTQIDRQVAADCLETAMVLAEESAVLDCQGLILRDVHLGEISLEGKELNGLRLEDCFIDAVTIDETGVGSGIEVVNCYIQRVSGAASREALPGRIFQNCEADSFDDLSTNAAIVRSAMLPRVKALLTILRKLYLQGGSGRKPSAFRRGLPTGPILDAVDPILEAVLSNGLATVDQGVYQPLRQQGPRVRAILSAGNLSTDSIVVFAKSGG